MSNITEPISHIYCILCFIDKFTAFSDALKDLNLELVGPYDILAGKQFQTMENSASLCLHYRYFYDPPEFVTVLKGDDNVGLHIGYYR